MSDAPYRPARIHETLGEPFFDAVKAADFPQTILRYRNDRWALRVGLGELTDEAWIRHFGRFEPLPENMPKPLALRYHGHQFRSYNPDIGDGRGFLFAQLRDGDDRLLDLGTKGSGQTPFSRSGDGRLTLKGGVREVLATAMLEALGVDTSKTFSLIETGEKLQRGDEPSPTRSAVLVRLSHSHIRIGTFQRLLAYRDADAITRLVAHCTAHYLPSARRDDPADEAVAFLSEVVSRTTATAARWMAAGFVHGVLNSDNINITGESFDYGPYRFLPFYDPGFTAAYFDEWGLYAFGRQPDAIGWNLARLAECLTLVAPLERLTPELERFGEKFWPALRIAIAERLGLAPADDDAEDALIKALFAFLGATKIPFEPAMFDLYGGAARLDKALAGPRAEHYRHGSFGELKAALDWRSAIGRIDDPYFQREEPLSLVYEEIERLWAPIAERDDWALFEAKLAEIKVVREAYGLAA